MAVAERRDEMVLWRRSFDFQGVDDGVVFFGDVRASFCCRSSASEMWLVLWSRVMVFTEEEEWVLILVRCCHGSLISEITEFWLLVGQVFA